MLIGNLITFNDELTDDPDTDNNDEWGKGKSKELSWFNSNDVNFTTKATSTRIKMQTKGTVVINYDQLKSNNIYF